MVGRRRGSTTRRTTARPRPGVGVILNHWGCGKSSRPSTGPRRDRHGTLEVADRDRRLGSLYGSHADGLQRAVHRRWNLQSKGWIDWTGQSGSESRFGLEDGWRLQAEDHHHHVRTGHRVGLGGHRESTQRDGREWQLRLLLTEGRIHLRGVLLYSRDVRLQVLDPSRHEGNRQCHLTTGEAEKTPTLPRGGGKCNGRDHLDVVGIN